MTTTYQDFLSARRKKKLKCMFQLYLRQTLAGALLCKRRQVSCARIWPSSGQQVFGKVRISPAGGEGLAKIKKNILTYLHCSNKIQECV